MAQPSFVVGLVHLAEHFGTAAVLRDTDIAACAGGVGID